MERYAIAVAPSLKLLDPKPLLKKEVRVLTAGIGKEAPSYRGKAYNSLPKVEQELEAINDTMRQSEELVDEKFTKITI